MISTVSPRQDFPPMAGTSLLSRLLGNRADDHAGVRPLWHALVEQARHKDWYARHGIADTLAGRFDAITLVLSLVLLRMEHEETLKTHCALLTELFVTDMDGQLREAGVGDVVVGKHIGRLMGVLGGRLGAYRTALEDAEDGQLAAALTRNITLSPGADVAALAQATRALFTRLQAQDAPTLLAGNIA
jgi:cytochrome b pre-mRNA-processing protein 3